MSPKRKKVGLDIGHGVNTYPPSKGVPGLPEHTFNAEVAIQVKALLEFNGFEVVMAQQPYKNDVVLAARSKFYNDQKVDIVCSIHANASANANADGVGAFYWHTSTNGKRLVDLYVDEAKKAKLALWGSGVWKSEPNSWTNFHMVRETNAPAILTENGFMTNSKDKALLLSAEYRTLIAELHVKMICRYFNVEFKKPAPPKPKAKVDENLFFRVVTGSFNTRELAEQRMADLKKAGFDSFLLPYRKDEK